MVKIPERALRVVRTPKKVYDLLNPPSFDELELKQYEKYPELNETFYNNLLEYMNERGWPKYCSREWLVDDMFERYYPTADTRTSIRYKATTSDFGRAMRKRAKEILSSFGYSYLGSPRKRRALCFVRGNNNDLDNKKEVNVNEIREKIASECRY